MIPVPLGAFVVLHPTVYFLELAQRGGMKQSGIGRENGLEAFEACMYIPSLTAFFFHKLTPSSF